MSIRLFILGCLAKQPCHPYMIKKIISDLTPIEQQMKASDGKLYYHFEALTKKGYITELEVTKEGHRPEKTIYEITETGRQDLQEEIYKSFKNLSDVSTLYVAIYFLQYVDPQKVASILEKGIKKKKENLNYFTQLYQKAKKDTEIKNDPSLKLITKHSFSSTEFDIKWLEELLRYIYNIKN